MKKLPITLLIVAITAMQVNAQQTYYDVSSGNGNGLRFWSSDHYKIHMGNASEYQYGPVTEYSIKMNMNDDSDRGWTWGIIGTTPIAALNTQGKFQIANSFTANGGGIFNGSILSQGIPVLAVNNTFQSYSTDHILNRPFVIRRNTSNNEAFFTFIQDTKTHFVYQNDEAVSAVEFKLINTDTEVGGGANANTNVVLYLHGDSNGGRVRIGGSATPTEKLVVDGKILAEEVKVQTVPASDYVFEPDYDLKPLEEVDQFIQQNKHLPDIPSAEEFKENGVGLGEMDDMLLRKVEELTLYVIELKKENLEMKTEIRNLKHQ
jgi:hypothetical protein